jgi:hypothetical protein
MDDIYISQTAGGRHGPDHDIILAGPPYKYHSDHAVDISRKMIEPLYYAQQDGDITRTMM